MSLHEHCDIAAKTILQLETFAELVGVDRFSRMVLVTKLGSCKRATQIGLAQGEPGMDAAFWSMLAAALLQ